MRRIFSQLLKKPLFFLYILLVSISSHLAVASDEANGVKLNDQVKALKQAVLALNKNLFILEEELLYPSETQLSLYVSLDIGEYFKLDAVKIMLDGEQITAHLYTDKQLSALHRGGIQELYRGNVKSGRHELVAVFTGFGPKGNDYRRAVSMNFDKEDDATNLELKIIDSKAKQAPEFIVKEW